MEMNKNLSVIDLFCGVGGLTHGLLKAGIEVKAGIDQDSNCKYAYETNNNAEFISDDITNIQGEQLLQKYWNDKNIKILVGCAPCQPFSNLSNTKKNKESSSKWNLLGEFKRLIGETKPDIVSMENVPNLSNKNIFNEFVDFLKEKKYFVEYKNVFCPDYGIPQRRRRLVLLASTKGEIKLLPKTHTPENYKTTKDAIGHLQPVVSGVTNQLDELHKAIKLSDKNLKRIRASKPKGTWLDWDKSLRLNCHKKKTGNTYKSVYGRMSWDEPSPTITTQFYNYGTGRFGHPDQDRALTMREAAILQTFPEKYRFYQNSDEICFKRIGAHIGNAVPVDLGYIIGMSIINHLKYTKDNE